MGSPRHLSVRVLALLVALLAAPPSWGQAEDAEPVTDEPGEEPPVAEDPVVSACLASFDASQLLRRERKLLAAKAELLSCSQERCPTVVVVKCQEWLEEVKESLPTVVIAARDGTKDVFDVKVLVDGLLAHRSLTGTALELDPGPRRIVAERGGRHIERTVLVREGHKNRPIEFDFTPAPRPLPPAPPVPVKPPDDGFSLPVLSWVGFGVGLAGIIVGSITGGIAISEGEALEAECPNGRCPESFSGQFGPGETIAHVSTVSFAVAGAGVVLGVVGLFMADGEEERPKTTAWGLMGRF